MSPYTPSTFSPSDDSGTTPDTGAMGGASQSSGAGDSTGSGRDMTGRVAQGAHDTIDRLSETVAPQVQRLQQSVSSATDAVKLRAGQLRETGEEWVDTLRSTVRENPLTAIGVGMAVGMLLSRLTRR